MNNKIYSPSSGEELSFGNDGLLHTPSGNAYLLDGQKNLIPLLSPASGTPLIKKRDGLFYSEHELVNYILLDGKFKPLLSPINGSPLFKGENGLYFSEHTSKQYILTETGIIKELTDPFNGGNLTLNADGTYTSDTTDKNFELYNGNFVSLHVPDGTNEPAHIKDGMLVGNETGRAYRIDESGVILTPEEIAFRAEQKKKLDEIEVKVQNDIAKKIEDIFTQESKIEGLTSEELKKAQLELYPDLAEISDILPLSQEEIDKLKPIINKAIEIDPKRPKGLL